MENQQNVHHTEQNVLTTHKKVCIIELRTVHDAEQLHCYFIKTRCKNEKKIEPYRL